VSWGDLIGGADRITSTIFDPREAGLYGPASSLNDEWYGTGFTDTIFGGNGNDTRLLNGGLAVGTLAAADFDIVA
jgi:hypothetical protein